MKPSPVPEHWEDRTLIKSALRESRTWNPVGLRNDILEDALGCLTIIGVDPGGTTGWSVLKVDYQRLVDQSLPIDNAITQWRHGQIDCGANSGNAATSATANDLELGISETGEAAGVWLMENIIRQNSMFPGSTAVVIEDFILRTSNKGRDALSPVRITAALQQLLWEGQYVEVFKQQPSEAKSALTDERLKRRGFYDSSGAARHARDADRHALLFLQKCRQKPSQMKKAWPVIAEAQKRAVI